MDAGSAAHSGFVGALAYGRENNLEGYYTLHLWRGVFASLDLQHINHSGYNRARGPLVVSGLRLHVEFWPDGALTPSRPSPRMN